MKLLRLALLALALAACDGVLNPERSTGCGRDDPTVPRTEPDWHALEQQDVETIDAPTPEG